MDCREPNVRGAVVHQRRVPEGGDFSANGRLIAVLAEARITASTVRLRDIHGMQDRQAAAR